MKFFGKSWGAPICEEIAQIEVPVGSVCSHCEEVFLAGDQGVQYDNVEPVFMHLNCHLRGILGSVSHQLKECSCYVKGASETDPPELTRRQAANLAVDIYERNNR